MSSLRDSVYRALSAIPKGQVISYQELARRIGVPSAIRAVATLVGKNPEPIIVPCHRVIKSNGELGNYTWKGLPNPTKKLALLKAEGVLFEKIMRKRGSKVQVEEVLVIYRLNKAPKGAIL
jgi:O-6-methylguanine DNA methyltransferase